MYIYMYIYICLYVHVCLPFLHIRTYIHKCSAVHAPKGENHHRAMICDRGRSKLQGAPGGSRIARITQLS